MRRVHNYRDNDRHRPYRRGNGDDYRELREEREARNELERVQNELRDSEQQRRALSRQLAGRERAHCTSIGQTVTGKLSTLQNQRN